MIVWLASYPRSGNTFFRTILKSVFGFSTYSVYNDKNDIASNPLLKNVTGHELLGPGDIEQFRASENYYFIKTHDLPSAQQMNDKVIYLVRDGRGATYSFCRYLRQFTDSQQKYSFNDIVNGEHFFGSWQGHVRAWQAIDASQLQVVRFEEIISSAEDTIARIASFLSIEPKSNVVHSFSHLNAIDSKFFRSGKADSWKKELSEIEHDYFWSQSYEEMIRMSYTDGVPAYYENHGVREVIRLINTNLVTSLRHSLEKKSNEQAHLLKEQAEREKHIVELQNVSTTKAAECVGLQNAIGALNGDVSRLQGENSTLKSDCSRLETEKDALGEQCVSLQNATEDLVADRDRIQTASSALDLALIDLQKQYDLMKKSFDILEQSNRELTQSHGVLVEKHTELQSQFAALTERNSALLEDNEFYKYYSEIFLNNIVFLKAVVTEFRIVSGLAGDLLGNYSENENVKRIEKALDAAQKRFV